MDDTHLPSFAEDRDVHPPWSCKHQRPVEVGSPKVIIRLKVSTCLPLHADPRISECFGTILPFTSTAPPRAIVRVHHVHPPHLHIDAPSCAPSFPSGQFPYVERATFHGVGLKPRNRGLSLPQHALQQLEAPESGQILPEKI